jgi:hypothetical protein
MRKTSRQLAAIISAALLADSATAIDFNLLSVGTDKSLKFTGSVNVGGTVYELAADSGKVQTFPDVDSFVKKVAKFNEDGEGVYTVTIDTGALLASSVPANLVAAKAAKVVSLTKIKAAQNAVVVALDAQIALMPGWEVGNAAQRAKLAEVQAQKVAVVGDIAAIDAEILALS